MPHHYLLPNLNIYIWAYTKKLYTYIQFSLNLRLENLHSGHIQKNLTSAPCISTNLGCRKNKIFYTPTTSSRNHQNLTYLIYFGRCRVKIPYTPKPASNSPPPHPIAENSSLYTHPITPKITATLFTLAATSGENKSFSELP